MENASKALIIAGAILLSILLISLGIMVYNNAKGTVSDANLDAESVQAFNTKFTQYGGTQRGTALNALIDAAIASNAKSGHEVKFKIGSGKTEKTAIDVDRYASSDSKTVSFEYGTDGYVSYIVIP